MNSHHIQFQCFKNLAKPQCYSNININIHQFAIENIIMAHTHIQLCPELIIPLVNMIKKKMLRFCQEEDVCLYFLNGWWGWKFE